MSKMPLMVLSLLKSEQIAINSKDLFKTTQESKEKHQGINCSTIGIWSRFNPLWEPCPHLQVCLITKLLRLWKESDLLEDCRQVRIIMLRIRRRGRVCFRGRIEHQANSLVKIHTWTWLTSHSSSTELQDRALKCPLTLLIKSVT